jgi:uncharacterized membrane protein YheB (UPF0754 family)
MKVAKILTIWLTILSLIIASVLGLIQIADHFGRKDSDKKIAKTQAQVLAELIKDYLRNSENEITIENKNEVRHLDGVQVEVIAKQLENKYLNKDSNNPKQAILDSFSKLNDEDKLKFIRKLNEEIKQ